MRAHILSIGLITFVFVLLSTIQPSSSQIVGCDGLHIECPSKQSATDGGICGYNEDGIGVVSFDSNNTTEGPLTWTVRAVDAPNGGPHASRTGRAFYLGTPPSLNLSEVTDFGACTAFLWNLTSTLQLPPGFSDFNDFGCNTIMDPQCARDVVSSARNELLRLLEDASYDADRDGSPCTMVTQRIRVLPPPESCGGLINPDRYAYGPPLTLTNGTSSDSSVYMNQDDCSITTGGANYNLVSGLVEDSIQYFADSQEPSKECTALYKTGTTPIMTFFYNEPWNNASTGPAPFLSEPEVHMSCLRTVPTADQESGSSRLGSSLLGLFTAVLVVSILWCF